MVGWLFRTEIDTHTDRHTDNVDRTVAYND